MRPFVVFAILVVAVSADFKFGGGGRTVIVDDDGSSGGGGDAGGTGGDGGGTGGDAASMGGGGAGMGGGESGASGAGRYWCTCRPKKCFYKELPLDKKCRLFPLFPSFFDTCCRWFPWWVTDRAPGPVIGFGPNGGGFGLGGVGLGFSGPNVGFSGQDSGISITVGKSSSYDGGYH